MPKTYHKLPPTPEPLDDPQLIQRQPGEQHLRGIGVHQLPCEQSPELAVVDDVGSDGEPEEVFGICDRGQQRRGHDAHD